MIAAHLAEQLLEAPDGSFVLAEWTDAAESSRHARVAPLHRHLDEDEAWYVLEGSPGFSLTRERDPTRACKRGQAGRPDPDDDAEPGGSDLLV